MSKSSRSYILGTGQRFLREVYDIIAFLYEAISGVDWAEGEIAPEPAQAPTGVRTRCLVGKHGRECWVGDEWKEQSLFATRINFQKIGTWILSGCAYNYTNAPGQLVRARAFK